jgi:hypothetical protein
MENGLTKEENIILNMLLAKRDKNNIVKPVEQKIKKLTRKEISEIVKRDREENKSKKFPI